MLFGTRVAAIAAMLAADAPPGSYVVGQPMDAVEQPESKTVVDRLERANSPSTSQAVAHFPFPDQRTGDWGFAAAGATSSAARAQRTHPSPFGVSSLHLSLIHI